MNFKVTLDNGITLDLKAKSEKEVKVISAMFEKALSEKSKELVKVLKIEKVK